MFKIAIIGAGYMAEEHIKVFHSLSEAKVVGIYSRTLDKSAHLASKYNIDFVAKSIPELYNQTEASLVVIAVNIEETYNIASMSFKYPWIILLEKPAGCDLQEADALLKLAKQTKSNIYVALNRRYYSSTKYVIEDLKHNHDKKYIHIQDQQDLHLSSEHRFHPKVIKNWMFANSIHLIDYLTLFCSGEVESITPIIRWDPNNPNIVIAKVKYTSGDIGIYEGIWNGSPGPWSVSINTKSKRYEMRPLESCQYQLQNERILNNTELSWQDKKWKPGLYLQAKDCINKLREENHSLVSLEESYKSMRLVAEIFSIK